MADALDALAAGVPRTLLVTLAALLVGVAAAVPLTVARRSAHALVRLPADAAVDVLRSVPPVAWLFLLYFGLPSVGAEPPALGAAVVGLGLIAAAYVAEIYRAGLASVPPEQDAAARALGLGPMDRIRHVVGPQALVVVLPALGTYAVGLLKDSAIVSTIGVADVTYHALGESQRTLDGLAVFGAAAVLYLAMSLPVGLLARHLAARHADGVGAR
jgi:polar amino acid transport system permease protein